MALIEKLENIGNAIRTKTGKTDLLTLDEMVTEIGNIETGGSGGGDVSEYFNTEITSNTSNSLNTSLLTQLVKKLPSISLGSGVTSLQSAFMYFKGDTIPQLNTSKVTNMSSMFFHADNIKTIPLIDTSNVTNMSGMFMHSLSLETIPQLDTGKVTNMQNMFYTDVNSSLTSLPPLNASQVVNITSVINTAISTNRDALTELGGFINLGNAYLTTSSANYSNYTLTLKNCEQLTHDSLINVINNLYDIGAKGCNTQKLELGSRNLSKLTADEIAIATNKGWTVS